MIPRFISYYRVSTKRQGRSGLGLEAQQTDVLRLIAESGGSEIAHYTEIETGRNPDRPELAKAIAHAKLSNATLVVAKLDRLARNVAFTAALMESKVDFVCCDCKGANTLTLHILAAIAQEESRVIGERTRKALAAAKARGVRLGSKRPGRWTDKQNGWQAAQAKSVASRQKQTAKAYENMLPTMRRLREEGKTVAQVAGWLNSQGFLTTAKKPFTEPAVWRVLRRYCPELATIRRPGVVRRVPITRPRALENVLAARCHSSISVHE
jgi:DNA invertase Pin-like site-specific DNA recombinase